MAYFDLKARNAEKERQRELGEKLKEERRAKMAALRKAPLSALANLPALPGSIRISAPSAAPPNSDGPQKSESPEQPALAPSLSRSLAPLKSTLHRSPSRSVLCPLGQTPTSEKGALAEDQSQPLSISKRSRSRRRPSSADTEKVPFSSKVVISQTLLGTGAFGAVYLGVHEDTGQMIAIKKITIGNANNKETREQIEQLASEIRLMKQLDHPNIVKYLHAERQEQQLLIYMELMSGGSLASLMKKFTKLPESVMRVYMRQVLVGLAYLHQRNVVHRDIKADNILMASDGTAKISDFGTSREFNDSANLLTVTGTPWFMAPEVIKGSEGVGHGAPADIWSIGCTIIELVQGRPPFWQHNNPMTVMFNIGLHPEKILDEIPKEVSPELRDLLQCCLREEPSQRITAKQILDHPFFRDEDSSDSESGDAEVAPKTAEVAAPVAAKDGARRSSVLEPRPPVPSLGGTGNVPVPMGIHAVGGLRSSVGNTRPSTPPAPGTPRSTYAQRLRDETQFQQK